MSKLKSIRYLNKLDAFYFDHSDAIITAYSDHVISGVDADTDSELYFYKFMGDLYEATRGTPTLNCVHDGDRFHYHVTKIYNNMLGSSSTNEENAHE